MPRAIVGLPAELPAAARVERRPVTVGHEAAAHSAASQPKRGSGLTLSLNGFQGPADTSPFLSVPVRLCPHMTQASRRIAKTTPDQSTPSSDSSTSVSSWPQLFDMTSPSVFRYGTLVRTPL